MESTGFQRLILIFIVLSGWFADAQPQVVLLRKENVIYRISTGQSIRYKLKSENKSQYRVLTGTWEFGFVSQMDSIPYSAVSHLNTAGRSTFLSRLGGGLFIAGFGYFLIDQFNEGIIAGNGFTISERVLKPSAALVITGALLKLTRKRWYPTDLGRYNLKTANPDSPFYLQLN